MKSQRGGWVWRTVPLTVVFALAVLGVLWWTGVLFARKAYRGETWTVRKEVLKVTIVARGNLESVHNKDVYCTVRAGTKGSTIATVIKSIIDEGTEVKKGQLIMELDSSGYNEQLKDKNKDVDKAYADKVAADQGVLIQTSQNESDVEAAKNARDLARIELEKYVKGDFIKDLEDLKGKIETAESDLSDWKERSSWSARMVKKGLMSKVQADADASRAEAARINLDNLKLQKRVLEDYTRKREVQDKTAKLAESERSLKRVQLQARANLALKEADQKSKESIYQAELTRKREIQREIDKCLIYAPQDGLVVYYVPEQVRGGGGAQQSVVAQGEPVREGQKMIQIPDLSKMLVTVRVPEAFVAHLRSEKSGGPPQWAQIRVDSYSKSTLKGFVKSVDTVASTQDWFASDVKVYKTKVVITDRAEGLKPGMSAEVTIFADETPEPVLVLPVQAVLGTISMGAQRKCFVIGRNGQPEMRNIVVGISNERLVEVKPWDDATQTGLKEGEQVVLNPAPLVKDESDLRPGKPRPAPSGASQDAAGGGFGTEKQAPKGGKKGWKGKKGKPEGKPTQKDEAWAPRQRLGLFRPGLDAGA
jgi:multidrug efflux pump subunit AcrA (membrane-fusion protein)